MFTPGYPAFAASISTFNLEGSQHTEVEMNPEETEQIKMNTSFE